MKRMKKVFAMLLAFAMVMGMSLTAFAAEKEATITVNNAGDAKFNCVQLVAPNLNTTTGWDIVDTYAEAFTNAFGVDEQQVLAGMIYEAATEEEREEVGFKGVEIEGFSSKYALALSTIHGSVAPGTLTSPITVDEAGVYLIKGTNDDNYTYSPMAAYVAFGPYDTETGIPTDLVDTSVEAKRVPLKVEKVANGESDAAVAIGQEKTYSITSTVPFIPLTNGEREYKFTDTISGAEYVTQVVDGVEKVVVKVVIGTGSEKTYYGDLSEDGTSFTVDLEEVIASNANANLDITLTYKAVVTGTTVSNNVVVNDGQFGSDSVTLYTGKITLTKYDAANENIKLAGAGFEVKDADGNVLKFVQKDENVNVYTFDPAGTITEVFTDDNGLVVVEGLDVGTYTFTEKTAPEGYSINDNPVNVTLGDEEVFEDGVAKAIFEDAGEIADTKLSALPSTGGIGTAVFTIGGCAIMVAAAYFFLVSRKKES